MTKDAFRRVTELDSNPLGLPNEVSDWSVWIQSCSESEFEVPKELEGAVLKRKREFAAGRQCAKQALARFGDTSNIAIRDDRAPVWPNGIVGSISHSREIAWAAVARSSSLRGIGIDAELVIKQETATEIRDRVVNRDEANCLAASNLPEPMRTTIAFCTKESVYKCLYPLFGITLDFSDVTLRQVDPRAGAFVAEVSGKIREVQVLSGRFYRGLGHVFSAAWLV